MHLDIFANGVVECINQISSTVLVIEVVKLLLSEHVQGKFLCILSSKHVCVRSSRYIARSEKELFGVYAWKNLRYLIICKFQSRNIVIGCSRMVQLTQILENNKKTCVYVLILTVKKTQVDTYEPMIFIIESVESI